MQQNVNWVLKKIVTRLFKFVATQYLLKRGLKVKQFRYILNTFFLSIETIFFFRHAPRLVDMVDKAVDFLENDNKKGYFLLIEVNNY